MKLCIALLLVVAASATDIHKESGHLDSAAEGKENTQQYQGNDQQLLQAQSAKESTKGDGATGHVATVNHVSASDWPLPREKMPEGFSPWLEFQMMQEKNEKGETQVREHLLRCGVEKDENGKEKCELVAVRRAASAKLVMLPKLPKSSGLL